MPSEMRTSVLIIAIDMRIDHFIAGALSAVLDDIFFRNLF